MNDQLREELSQALSARPERFVPVSGGCINRAFACDLSDGRRVFIKSNEGCDSRMFRSEAAGLAWLAEASSLRIPEVLAVGDAFLALEFIEAASPGPHYDRDLGRGLAQLHRFGAPEFGWSEEGFLATLPQDNRPSESWPEFYVERRLRPLLRRAIDRKLAPSSLSKDFDELFARMPELVGDESDAARLHGDLWSGNVHTDPQGNPVLVDPAVYGGNREIDLAMLRLFGSPGRSFYDAYHAEWPLEEGHEKRVALYQLYPLLAHVNLFPGSYLSSCEQALAQYL
jgi:fructosamine-3-kinase